MDIQYILEVKDLDADESIYSLSSASPDVIEGSLLIAGRLAEKYKAETLEEKREQKRDSEREEQLEHEKNLNN